MCCYYYSNAAVEMQWAYSSKKHEAEGKEDAKIMQSVQ